MNIRKTCVALLILIFNTNCASDKLESTEQDLSSVKGSGIQPTEVLIVPATRKPFEYLITTSGKIEATREVQVQFRVSGVILEIFRKNGQSVEKGDIIANIDSQRYVLEVAKANVALKEKRLVFEDQLMFSFKDANEQKHLLIKENIRHSSGLASAEISYKQATLDLENTVVRAPISGVISNLSIREGNVVKSDEAFCLIHDQFSLRVTCEVLEADAYNLFLGQKADVQPLFEKEVIYQANVSEINPRVSVTTGLVRVELTLKQSSKLLPGMNVGVVLKVPSKKNVIVPKEAIVVRSGKHVVFTFENGLAKWNYVVLGRENGKEIEVVEGLNESQSIIVSNNLQLAHDAPVKVISR